MRKLLVALALILTGCKTTSEMKTIGNIEKQDPSLDAIVSSDATIEILAEGFEWSEGPLWIASEKMLLFSDVPKNVIQKWTEENGLELYLTPSGYTGTTPSASNEPGSNGLTLDNEGKLILAQHGDRRIARMESDLENPRPVYTTIAERFDGKRFSSPNDVVVRKNGDVFFTDPPYGLPEQDKDASKEIPFQGVFKVGNDGRVVLISDSLSRPNGLAFLNDRTLLVANSDPERAAWYRLELDESDSVQQFSLFHDATSNAKQGEPGLPDGLKVDTQGNIFASGPGGIWIFNSQGKLLGKIKLPVPAANCALSNDNKTLYITADMYLLRVILRK